MVPVRVQEAMRQLAAAVKYAHYRSKPEILAEYLVEADIVEEWLAPKPQAPQPSWDDAPAEANWWIVHSDGLEEWWCIKNDGYPYADGSSWEVSGARWDDGTWKPCGSGRKHNIDIGIDWRELRQRRPEAT